VKKIIEMGLSAAFFINHHFQLVLILPLL
jgi:hypothetical protein